MNIWELPDPVRIAAAQQRLTALLTLCPGSAERQRAHLGEETERVVPIVTAGGLRRAA